MYNTFGVFRAYSLHFSFKQLASVLLPLWFYESKYAMHLYSDIMMAASAGIYYRKQKSSFTPRTHSSHCYSIKLLTVLSSSLPLSFSFSFFLDLSLSLSHTHTHTLTHTDGSPAKRRRSQTALERPAVLMALPAVAQWTLLAPPHTTPVPLSPPPPRHHLLMTGKTGSVFCTAVPL